MNEPAIAARGETKWEQTRRILAEQFSCLDSVSAVGVTYFNGNGEVNVPIAPYTEQQQDAMIRAMFAVEPTGSAPTLWAWRGALERITGWSSPTPGVDDPRVIVLVVDGVPTADEDHSPSGPGPNGTITESEYDQLIQTVAREGTGLARVNTWIFGVPGSDDPRGAPYDPLFQLSRLAVAGGTCGAPCPVPTTGVVESCHDAIRERESTCLVIPGRYCHQDMRRAFDFTPAPGFSWVRRNVLAGMAHPGSGAALARSLDYLAWKGVGLIVSLTTDPVDVPSARARGIAVLHLPVADFTAPSQGQIAEFITEARSAMAGGSAVVVQCGAGLGRTGTMLACYFVSEGMGAEEAIARVRELRPGSIETQDQMQAIHDYAAGTGQPASPVGSASTP